MRTMLMIFSLFVVPFSSADECYLTPEQRSVLYFSYSYGSPHDYGYTLAAIEMEESGNQPTRPVGFTMGCYDR